MKTLLIDNHDSFTYNLFQLLAEVNGVEPLVIRNDEVSWEDLRELDFDNVVVSPGPGRPERVRDFGVSARAISESEVPLLGVCLGHQGLAWIHGADIVAAPEPVHGRIATVRHTGEGLFAGLPDELRAVRYHSLCVAEPLPDELEAIAWSADGVVMAVAHRTLPRWGVQFHPESVCTEHGRRLLDNFRALTALHGGGGAGQNPAAGRGGAPSVDQRTRRDGGWAHGGGTRRAVPGPAPGDTGAGGAIAPAAAAEVQRPELLVRRIDDLHDPEGAFAALHGDSRDAFWLDSGVGGEGARFSFVGAAGGPLSATVAYDVGSGELTVRRGGEVERRRESVFAFLARELDRLRPTEPDEPLPFDLDCGFVGYFGYELKAECGGRAAHSSDMPDAAFVFVDRLIAFDHRERRTYLVCLTDAANAVAGRHWLEATERRLATLPPLPEPPDAMPGDGATSDAEDDGGQTDRIVVGDNGETARLARSHERYVEDIAACKQALAAGESYEICLTDRLTADAADRDPFELYRVLRGVNPAPYAAYLRFGDSAVLSSSPERFLRVGRDRRVEAKPIKGTSRRGATPAEDARLADELRAGEKSRAENLMICDLLRNDLGSVCEVGTVHVPSLMAVESYETVHQLVSTVRGLLRDDVDLPGCVRACFPPGSMTGAPKERTMEILDGLEDGARGVYSGALGYLGVGGACDLSVVIRTIVLHDGAARIGTGGAIVMQSDPEEEWREALLKAQAPLRALEATRPVPAS